MSTTRRKRRGNELRAASVRAALAAGLGAGVLAAVGGPRPTGIAAWDVALVVAAHEEALLIPKRALVYDQDQVFVYRMKGDDEVERLLLAPRLEDKLNVEPEAGFAAGERVVVAGQAGLKDGAKVRVVGARTDDSAPADELEAAR